MLTTLWRVNPFLYIKVEKHKIWMMMTLSDFYEFKMSPPRLVYYLGPAAPFQGGVVGCGNMTDSLVATNATLAGCWVGVCARLRADEFYYSRTLKALLCAGGF